MVAIRMVAIRPNGRPDDIGLEHRDFAAAPADEAVAVYEVDIGADRPLVLPVRSGVAVTGREDDIIAAAREGLRVLLTAVIGAATERYGRRGD